MSIWERFKLMRILWQEARELEREGVFKRAKDYPTILDHTGRISPDVRPPSLEGDGKAEFLPDMTEEETKDYLHEEVLGWKNFSDRIKRKLRGE